MDKTKTACKSTRKEDGDFLLKWMAILLLVLVVVLCVDNTEDVPDTDPDTGFFTTIKWAIHTMETAPQEPTYRYPAPTSTDVDGNRLR